MNPNERSTSFSHRLHSLPDQREPPRACSGTFTQKRRSPTFSVAWILGDKVLPTSITTYMAGRSDQAVNQGGRNGDSNPIPMLMLMLMFDYTGRADVLYPMDGDGKN